MRDINPDPYGPRERSIRNIPVSRASHAREPERPARPRRRGRRPRFLLALVIVVIICVAGGALLSTVFAGAKVSVSPRTESVSPTGTIVAQLNGPSTALAYQEITVTRSATTTVPATGTKQVSRQASGVVTITNTYSTASQRLIANTRFEASDGKIYRVHDSVVVPGMSGATAGTVQATIYADSPGDTYNKAAGAVFTIPGFKGDPRYAKFSARAEGAIAGGFIGSEPAVADSDLSKAQAALSTELNTQITALAAASIADGSVAIPGTLKITLGAPVTTPASSGSASIVESATAIGAVVRLNDLAAAIAHATVKDYAGEAVSLSSDSKLDVTASTTDLTQGSLALKLSGSATLVWQFDPNAIKQALLGKPKSQFEDVLKSFAPGVRCSATTPCEATIRPFWQSSFPSDPAKITVTVAGTK